MALIAGAFLPVQTAVNNKMAMTVGSPILAALVSFVVGTFGLLIYALATGESVSSVASAKNAPAIAWIGGLLGAFFVTATVILLPRLGVALTISLIIAGQMAAAVAIDHYGLLGVPIKEVSLARLLGVLLVTAGVILIRKF